MNENGSCETSALAACCWQPKANNNLLPLLPLLLLLLLLLLSFCQSPTSRNCYLAEERARVLVRLLAALPLLRFNWLALQLACARAQLQARSPSRAGCWQCRLLSRISSQPAAKIPRDLAAKTARDLLSARAAKGAFAFSQPKVRSLARLPSARARNSPFVCAPFCAPNLRNDSRAIGEAAAARECKRASQPAKERTNEICLLGLAGCFRCVEIENLSDCLGEMRSTNLASQPAGRTCKFDPAGRQTPEGRLLPSSPSSRIQNLAACVQEVIQICRLRRRCRRLTRLSSSNKQPPRCWLEAPEVAAPATTCARIGGA